MLYFLIETKNKENISFNSLKEDEFEIVEISNNYEKLYSKMKELKFEIKLKNIFIKFFKAFGLFENKKIDLTNYFIFEYEKLPMTFSVFVNKMFQK